MPDRLFRCDCGRETTIHQPIDTIKTPICEECGELMKQVLTTPSVQFRGSGFYKTDK